MELTQPPPQSWFTPWYAQVRAHPVTAIGFGLAILVVLGSFIASIVEVLGGDATTSMRLALLGGFAGFIATAVGALPGVLLRAIPTRVEDSMLGLAAGMMLAASSFSLILPGLEAGKSLTDSAILGGGLVIVGMALGVLLMLGRDEFTHTNMKRPDPAARAASVSIACYCLCWPSPCRTSPRGSPSPWPCAVPALRRCTRC